MQIEIHKAKAKLTKSMVNQMHSAPQSEIEWAYSQKATALGYVTTVKGYAKVGIIKGRSDYYLLPIVSTRIESGQGSWNEELRDYGTVHRVIAERQGANVYYSFDDIEQRNAFHLKLKAMMNHCKVTHIYI